MTEKTSQKVADAAELSIAGHDFHLRYTPRSLKAIEQRFGSLFAVGEQLEELKAGKGQIVGFVFAVLAYGLQHEQVAGVAVDEDWLLDNGDLKQLTNYANAVFDALWQALPSDTVAHG